MRPVIGLTPLWDKSRGAMWMRPGYHDSVIAAGGIPFVLPFVEEEDQLEQLMDMCDALIFTGGQDVVPALYGEEPCVDNLECCEKRDTLEAALLKIALRKDMPVLGICRGLQFLNVAFGGPLYQDILAQRPSSLNHDEVPDFAVCTHHVDIIEDSPLGKYLGKESLFVNSLHHQGIKDLAPGLVCMANAEDGLIESFYRPDSRFFWAVQWHPEGLSAQDEDSMKLFTALIDVCR